VAKKLHVFVAKNIFISGKKAIHLFFEYSSVVSNTSKSLEWAKINVWQDLA
jgi:hypothetical protein